MWEQSPPGDEDGMASSLSRHPSLRIEHSPTLQEVTVWSSWKRESWDPKDDPQGTVGMDGACLDGLLAGPGPACTEQSCCTQ